MIIGKKNIYDMASYGIPQSHLEAIIDTAQKKDVVIGIRPVSTYAKSWISKGYPTKSFVIKNKTGREGPCQGLIAIDPQYGRYDAIDQSKTKGEEKYKKQITYALEQDEYLQPIPLVLTLDELKTLQNVALSETSEPQRYLLEWQKGDVKMSAEAVYNGEEFEIRDLDDEPIMVLGKLIMTQEAKAVLKPITADYDLLVVCPTFRDLELGRLSPDHSPLRTQSFDKESLQKALEKDKTIENAAQEDPKGGNWTPRVQNVVYMINQNIQKLDPKRGKSTFGLETVHHNAEFYNPYADSLSTSLPATIIFPRPMDLTSLYFEEQQSTLPNLQDVDCVIIESVEDLNVIRNYLKQKGYYWPTNANLKGEIPAFEPAAVEASAKFIHQRSQKNILKSMQQDNSDSDKENIDTGRKHHRNPKG